LSLSSSRVDKKTSRSEDLREDFIFQRAGMGETAGDCHQRGRRSGAMRAVRALLRCTSRRMIRLSLLGEVVVVDDMCRSPNAIVENNLSAVQQKGHRHKGCFVSCEERLTRL
jgi:hypothetical protein